MASKRRPDVQKLARKRNVRGLIKALRYRESGTGAWTGRDAQVRHKAAQALGMTSDRRAVKPLIASLDDESRFVREWAAWALGQIGDGRALEPLIASLEDKDWDVRKAVATSLGQLGDPRAVGPLVAALQGGGLLLNTAIRQALVKIGEPAVEPLTAALSHSGEWETDIAWVLGKIRRGRAGEVEDLLAALTDHSKLGSVDRRTGAARQLTRLYRETNLDPELQAQILAAQGAEIAPHRDRGPKRPKRCHCTHEDVAPTLFEL